MISDCHDAGRLGSPDFAPGGPAHQAHVMEPRRTLSGPEQAPLQRGRRGIHVPPGGNQNSGIRTGDGREQRYNLTATARYQLSQVTGGHIMGYQRQPNLTQDQALADLERAADATRSLRCSET